MSKHHARCPVPSYRLLIDDRVRGTLCQAHVLNEFAASNGLAVCRSALEMDPPRKGGPGCDLAAVDCILAVLAEVDFSFQGLPMSCSREVLGCLAPSMFLGGSAEMSAMESDGNSQAASMAHHFHDCGCYALTSLFLVRDTPRSRH